MPILKESYKVQVEARIMQLKSNLVSMRSISAFYNAIKTACDQLGMIGDFISSRDRLMYFTDGLRSRNYI